MGRLERERAKTQKAAAAAVGALAGIAAWALWPIEVTIPENPALQGAQLAVASPPEPAVVPIVDRVLWRRLPSRASVPATGRSGTPAAAVPALASLELIGITTQSGVPIAAVYDRAADRLLLVRSGESVAGRRVEAIEGRAMRLAAMPGEGAAAVLALAGVAR